MKTKKQLIKFLYTKKFCLILIVLILNSVICFPICLAQYENLNEIYKKAEEYYRQKEWKKAAHYYNRYIESANKNDNLYKKSLGVLAEIYYKHLKRYASAIRIYYELINNKFDKNIKSKVVWLSRDIDNDGFTYAQEHDLGLSDNVPILNEVDKLIPQNYSITYVKKGGFGGGIIKKLRFVKNNKEVYFYNEEEKDRKELDLEDFLKIWANLILVEPEDIPDEDTIYYEIKEKQILPKPAPLLVSDATSVEIILASDDKVTKIFIINTLELASRRLQEIVNYLEKPWSGDGSG